MIEPPLPSLPLNHIVSIVLGGGRGDLRRREGVEAGVQVELDDLADELRRQEVRELRRQRLGEGGEVGAFVGLEAGLAACKTLASSNKEQDAAEA